MLISLRSDHREHLTLLTDKSPQVLIDFCKLAIDFVQNGPNVKLYGVAANKLGVEQDAVQNCICGLVNLLLQACKYKLSDADFRDSVLTLGFGAEQQAVLSKFYESKKAEISEILRKISIKEPHYKDLDWRFEVILSSRALLHQVTPLITMDLKLETPTDDGEEKVERLLLQTDATNLKHVTSELEKALKESRSRHCRKIQRVLLS